MNAPDARNAAISCAGESAEDRALREALADLFGDCDAERAEEIHKLLPAPPDRPMASAPTDATNEPPS